MDDLSSGHAAWIARSLARTQHAPLTAADIIGLEEAGQVRRVPAGTLLVGAGSTVTHVHIVREGRVTLAIRPPGAGRRTIGIVRPGEVVADVPLLMKRPMPFDAFADIETTLLSIDGGLLLGLLADSPSLSLCWATLMAQRVEEAQHRLITLLTKDLAAQIATLLIDHRVRIDDAWLVPMSHQTIAHLLGSRRQSVSRVLGQMRRDGLVRSGYRSVEIADLEGVAALAGDTVGVEDPDEST